MMREIIGWMRKKNMSMSRSQKANLRICARCAFIFRRSENLGSTDCPLCNFSSYSAHYADGKKCYKNEKTQEPWLRNKLREHLTELENIASRYNKAFRKRNSEKVFHPRFQEEILF